MWKTKDSLPTSPFTTSARQSPAGVIYALEMRSSQTVRPSQTPGPLLARTVGEDSQASPGLEMDSPPSGARVYPPQERPRRRAVVSYVSTNLCDPFTAPLPECIDSSTLRLRLAEIADLELLFLWRNDVATRAASRFQHEVSLAEHRQWMLRTLGDPRRRLYIAVRGGHPVGTVRADFFQDYCELSWTVAPGWRGKGMGGLLVSLLAERIALPVRAEIRPGNTASERIARRCGMSLEGERNGMLQYGRPARGKP